jgi:hypothetical protein
MHVLGTIYAFYKYPTGGIARSASPPMPQIDFVRALSNSNAASPSGQGGSQPESSTPPPNQENIVPISKLRRIRLGRWGWTNIIFAATAILGGLFCTFYLFNGGERLRVVAAWPRDFLFPRALPAEDNTTDRARLAASLGLSPVPIVFGSSANRAGDPFSRTPDSLSLNSPTPPLERTISDAGPTSPDSPTPPTPRPTFSQLGSSAPGGDSLTQAVHHGAAEIARASKLEEKRTVMVVKTPVKLSGKHTASSEKRSLHIARRAHAQNTIGHFIAQMMRHHGDRRTAKVRGSFFLRHTHTSSDQRGRTARQRQQTASAARSAARPTSVSVSGSRGDNGLRGLSGRGLGALGGSPGGHGGGGGRAGAGGGGRH